jgi:hypothetical protein
MLSAQMTVWARYAAQNIDWFNPSFAHNIKPQFITQGG